MVGIFSKSVEDNALVLSIIAGADGKDGTASQTSVPDYAALSEQSGKYKIAYLDEAINKSKVLRNQASFIANKLELFEQTYLKDSE